jgi:hypothetical protein
MLSVLYKNKNDKKKSFAHLYTGVQWIDKFTIKFARDGQEMGKKMMSKNSYPKIY